MTLKELYEEVINSGEWKYYAPTDNFSFESLNDSKMCKGFIKKMIKAGEKETHPLYSFIDNLEQNRLQHIVSCFFLGFIFYTKFPCVKDSIDEMLEKLASTAAADNIAAAADVAAAADDVYGFKYVWFLICLFHDLGYAIEKDENGIKIKIPQLIKENLPDKPSNLPQIYTKNRIIQYGRYRDCKMGVKDHGIYGGIIFFSELCKLRRKKEETYTRLNWDEKLENTYACVAWIILCHNIFYIKTCDENMNCYKNYGLDKFIVDHARKIILKKHPLLFLFCLVDSIEPIKTVKDISFLSKIGSEIYDCKIKLDFSDLSDDKYFCKICDLQYWLVNISDDNRSVTIHMK